jgi:hypothetical protein
MRFWPEDAATTLAEDALFAEREIVFNFVLDFKFGDKIGGFCQS